MSFAFVLALMLALQAGPVPLDEIATYDRAAWDRTVTACDRLAGHHDDPEAVTEGVSREAMDLEAAIAACLDAVAADPDNPRLNYQLARAYGYSGLHDEGQAYRDAALRAGYPQSLFVVGYIRLTGWDGRDRDPCYGGELIRRSAEAGRFAGLVGFPHNKGSSDIQNQRIRPYFSFEKCRSRYSASIGPVHVQKLGLADDDRRPTTTTTTMTTTTIISLMKNSKKGIERTSHRSASEATNTI